MLKSSRPVIHFHAKLTRSHGLLLGVVLTPADLAMITSGHPLYLNLQDKVDLAKVGGIGVYFVRDSKELVKVLTGVGLEEREILEAGLNMDGTSFTPPPPKEPEEEPYFS